jgi:hypothetical protein
MAARWDELSRIYKAQTCLERGIRTGFGGDQRHSPVTAKNSRAGAAITRQLLFQMIYVRQSCSQSHQRTSSERQEKVLTRSPSDRNVASTQQMFES